MSQTYVMTIESLTRMYDEEVVLDNIWLSFYPGAKIGVLGINGSGKSTLLRIMAGEDKDFMGTVRPAKGLKIGYFPQEPRLDETQTVDQALQEAVGAPKENVRVWIHDVPKTNWGIAGQTAKDLGR